MTVESQIADLLAEPETPSGEHDIILAVDQAFHEADKARQTWMSKNHENRQAYMGLQDWSYKIEGQSKEFIPKVSNALEQFSSFLKRGLTQHGDWFSVDVPKDSMLNGANVRSIVLHYLNMLPEQRNKTTTFPVRLTDAVKMGALESLMIMKVIGRRVPSTGFKVSGDRVVKGDVRPWRLDLCVIRSEDYFPDPTGRGMYEIHRSEVDIQEIIDLSEGSNPIYDPVEVQRLIDSRAQSNIDEQEQRTEAERGQDETDSARFRRTVVIKEYWGDILNRDGTIAHRNIVCAVADDQFLIRKPETNPFWHSESPFIVAPILRVPHSVWHKALYDDAVQINLAYNELFNLILDGAIASVWSIKQTRPDLLQNPEEVAEGIPQGANLVLKANAPLDAKAVEDLFTGQIPNDAVAVLGMLEREHNSAALTNELRQGNLPGKQVKATEIVEASQSISAIMDSVVSDLEQEFIQRVLRMAWLLILQSANDLHEGEIAALIGERKATQLMAMSRTERFTEFAEGVTFKVHGLSATMSRARDFQKLMALMQAAAQNPLLLRAFVQRYDEQKILTQMMKQMNLNPDQYERGADLTESGQEIAQRLKEVLQAAQVTSAIGRPGNNLADGGDAGLSAEINQEAQPSEV